MANAFRRRRAGGTVVAPILTNQSFTFGRDTRTGAGGMQVVNTGGSGTWSITAGNTGTDWQINSTTGVLSPNQDGGLSASYTLTVECAGAGGTDTCTVTLTGEANALDVRTDTELSAAYTYIKTQSLSSIWTIYVREGAVIGTSTSSAISLTGGAFTATINDANEGASEAAYDREAEAGWNAGGYLHLTCRTYLGAQIKTNMLFTGVAALQITNLDFTKQVNPSTYPTGGSAASFNPNITTKALVVQRNATFTAYPEVIIRDCRFGNSSTGVSNPFWCNALDLVNGEHAVVEDCIFDGCADVVQARSYARIAIRRCFMKNAIRDFIQNYPAVAADTNGKTEMRLEVTDTDMLLSVDREELWRGVHADAIQWSSPTCTLARSYFLKWNYVYLPHATDDATQGFYNDATTSNPISGVIANNLIAVSTPNSITIGNAPTPSPLEIRYNTLLRQVPTDNNGAVSDGTNSSVRWVGDDTTGPVTVSNNIVGKIWDTTPGGSNQTWTTDGVRTLRSGETITTSDNGFLSQMVSGTGVGSLPYELTGTFTYDSVNGYFPTTEPRTDTKANFRADMDALYSPNPSGSFVGKGHTGGASTPANARISQTGDYRISQTGDYRSHA